MLGATNRVVNVKTVASSANQSNPAAPNHNGVSRPSTPPAMTQAVMTRRNPKPLDVMNALAVALLEIERQGS
jgi:hypothetical protein